MKKRSAVTIPTKKEFQAASKSMAARIRAEEALKARVLVLCGSSPVFHDIYVWLPDGRCHIDVFVHSDSEIQSPAAIALREAVLRLARDLLKESREISVAVDSHERVLRDFNGSYFNRFR